jgi:N-acetylmuramoyl-L-alanine amidase
VLVGGVRVPEVGGRIERTPDGARVVLTMQPPTPYKVTRDGSKLTVRFDATALDVTPLTGFIKEFAPGARVDGLNLVIDLGPSAAVHKVEDDRAANTLTIDLYPAPPPPPPPPKPIVVPAPAPLPVPGVQVPQTAPTGPLPAPVPGNLRTIVIDPGHGGPDAGTVGAGGAKEKDIALQVARRLKAAIESRLGLRVLLTREGDDDVTVDRRTELANNNKADVFLSLHMNWSARPVSRGTQIYTLGLDSYHEQLAQADSQKRAVPVVGGGSRIIEPVPWDLAQLPYADQSASLGGVIARLLAEKNVPLFGKPTVLAPMRVLMGANMPAVLVEMGFLSNADDEKAAATAEWQSAVVEGLMAALSELRHGISAGAPPPGLAVRPEPAQVRR